MFSKLKGLFSTDVGIDLGTANCLVSVKGRGIVLQEPSVVAIETNTKQVIAVGIEAKRMLERCPPHILAIRPMQSGVIADPDITEAMLRYFINHEKVCPRSWFRKLFDYTKPRAAIAVPGGITEIERHAVEDAAKHAGVGEVTLVEEPMAAAIGVGLPVSEPAGSMIVDIGGGTCEVAIISLAGIVHSRSIHCAGDAMDQCIVNHMKRVYNLMIGSRSAEQVKITIGSAFPLEEEKTMEISGRDIVSGLPKTMTITSQEIRDSLNDPVSKIVEAVHQTLGDCAPELASDLIDRGIVLSGGSSMLTGLDKLIARETGLPVVLADDPLTAVANGASKLIEWDGFSKRRRS